MTTLTTGDNKFGPSRWYVSSTLVDGCTHTSIQSAINSAAAGDDIFIKPGTYTENPTLKTGVNLIGFKGDDVAGHVIILGNCTYSGGGTVSISNIELKTNSAACLTFNGSTLGNVYLDHCFINALNNTAITFSNSNGSSNLYLNNCTGTVGATTASLFAMSCPGIMNISQTTIVNNQTSITADTVTAGFCNFYYSTYQGTVTASSSGSVSGYYTQFQGGPSVAAGITAVTTGTGSNNFIECSFTGGAASALTVNGVGATVIGGAVYSSNTNAITGSGTLTYGGVEFGSTSSTVNVTTVILLVESPVKTSAITDTGITAYAVVTGGTSSTAPLQNVSGVGTLGQVLTSAGAAALPTWSTSAPVMTWSDNSGTFNAVAGNGYFITAASTPTLPASPSEGDRVSFVVDTASTCTVTGNTGQKIRIGAALSAAAGTAANNARGDSLNLVYRSTGTTWFSIGAPEGTWSVT